MNVFGSVRKFSVLLFLVGTVGWAQVGTLPSVQGEGVRLDNVGVVTLLAFLDTRTDPTAQTADPSRAQLSQLKSVARQYSSEGLRVVLVAADTSERATLTNFVADWGLQQIPLLLDGKGEAARAYQVTQLPTTLLVETGRVSVRWKGVTRPAELAFAVRRALGLSP